MTEEPAVARAEMTLMEAVELLTIRGVSGLPVLDSRGLLVGVLSEKDIVRALAMRTGKKVRASLLDMLVRPAGEETPEAIEGCRRILEEVRVEQAMTADPVTVEPDAPIRAAARIMKVNDVNRLPVVERGWLVGIFTRHDFTRR